MGSTLGNPGETLRAPGLTALADAHRENAMLNPSEPVRHGRPFGELGSILRGQSRVQGRDPPVFSARITGKSLITYSSIRQHEAGCETLAAIAPKLFAKL